MADIDKDMQELKREVIEARNLVIKTDNLLKNLHAEVKGVADKQRQNERRHISTSATAYILFTALAALGAYMYARGELRAKNDELAHTREERDTAKKAFDEAKVSEKDTKDESARALDLFERMAGNDDDKRNRSLTEVATMQPKRLTGLEVRALKDKAASLRQAAANDALETGKQAFTRRDYKAAADDLGRYVTLVTGKPDDNALFLLGQSRHALKDYKAAVEPLQAFLKVAPNSKSGDYANMILGESLAESGDREKAIQVYRTGADRFYESQFAPWMRTRARRLEQDLKGGAGAPPSGPGTASPAVADKPR